jgi:methylenetetrahydrofolate--tRNA-(uracil-5-)-methyltransferase
MNDRPVKIIGGGLAGSEAAWQLLRRSIPVRLYEMRPLKMTAAHKTGLLGELVCSNSLRSADILSAPGLLKEELRLAGSLIIEAALESRVPAGSAMAVDRQLFAEYITERLGSHPLFELVHEEIGEIPDDGIVLVSTGPLTPRAFSEALKGVLGGEYLYFYDAIAPIVDTDGIDYSIVFRASRYGKGGDDYLNCPMNEEEYNRFYDALISADRVRAREFEDERFFEGCMPIEVMAERGRDTLRYGPMKPVGLRDPRTGKEPHAVVQLRLENWQGSSYNMVGFQTRLKWPEQDRVFRLIPGLRDVEFLRYGSIHRNTFINGPRFLSDTLSLKNNPDVYVAGQLTGVEGYIESTATGLLAGINIWRRLTGRAPVIPPEETAHGGLLQYVTASSPEGFQPSNINFGLIPPPEERIRDKRKKKEYIVRRALGKWKEYLSEIRVN